MSARNIIFHSKITKKKKNSKNKKIHVKDWWFLSTVFEGCNTEMC